MRKKAAKPHHLHLLCPPAGWLFDDRDIDQKGAVGPEIGVGTVMLAAVGTVEKTGSGWVGHIARLCYQYIPHFDFPLVALAQVFLVIGGACAAQGEGAVVAGTQVFGRVE
ncbi:MAG TPA: hypothetical protein GX697_06285 [Firmicutes bacterium]|nr:hypothetical protein [Bacillota bacterium]